VARQRPSLPDRSFFKIGEVAEMVGVKTHVLRYWEGEFEQLRPKKTRGAHRHFTRADVDMAMQIRRLLHDEGYTVAGAKLRLAELHDRATVAPRREVALRAELLGLRADLARALQKLDVQSTQRPPEPEAEVRVESVVTAVARLRHPTKHR
jgi:DNA-binding transcriptional MerR regulator